METTTGLIFALIPFLAGDDALIGFGWLGILIGLPVLTGALAFQEWKRRHRLATVFENPFGDGQNLTGREIDERLGLLTRHLSIKAE